MSIKEQEPEKAPTMESVEEYLKEVFADIIEVDPSEINLDDDLKNYGLSSISFGMAFKKLQQRFPTITISDVLKGGSINELSSLLKERQETGKKV